MGYHNKAGSISRCRDDASAGVRAALPRVGEPANPMPRPNARPTARFDDAALEPSLRRLIPAPVILDEYRECGPLGGLVSAAGRVATPLVFAAAGDLPEIDASFVDDLEAEYAALQSAGGPPHAIVPVWPDGKLEPLAALYDAAALAHAGRLVLDGGGRRVTAVLDQMRVAAFAVRPQDEARLVNVNTPEDYRPFDS